MAIVFSLLAGILFGAGLMISDMVNPARVLNFLDVTGNWDPTLLFVMAGGVAVAAVGYRLVFRRGAPLVGGHFNLPAKRQVDMPLIGGAALFGVGWGLAGICPGPAIADLPTLEPKILLFVAAMLAGMILAKAWRDRPSATEAVRSNP
jgi:uncharacterized membrane protein YedE/YeeE